MDNPPELTTIKHLNLEISTRKCYYYNDIPLNKFYTDYYKIPKDTLIYKELTDDEILQDLQRIIILLKGPCKIHVIPHLNLKQRSTNAKIPDRDRLVNVLNRACNDLGIDFHDIGRFLENGVENTYIDTYMKDSMHYSYGHGDVMQFLQSQIQ